MPPHDKPSPGRFHALLDHSAAAWLILAIGLAMTLGLWQHFGTHFAERAQDRFLHRAEAAKNLLLSRMQAHEKILRGAAALFAAVITSAARNGGPTSMPSGSTDRCPGSRARASRR